MNEPEIKDESIYRLWMNYNNASTELRNAIASRIEKSMKERLFDTECELLKCDTAIYTDDYDANNNDYAKIIYIDPSGKLMVEGDSTIKPLSELPTDTIVSIFNDFESTLDELDTDN